MSAAGRAVVWSSLEAAGIVHGAPPPPVVTGAPWYVRVMLGISGWIGALCLFAFMAMGFSSLLENGVASMVVGLALCTGAAVLLRRASANDFVQQFSLAASLAGQGLVLSALLHAFGSSALAVACILAIVQAALFLWVPNAIHRVWSAAAAAVALAVALRELGLHMMSPGIIAGGFAVLWLAEFEAGVKAPRLRNAGHGLALALALVALAHGDLWPPVTRLGAFPFGFAGFSSSAVVVWAAVQLMLREGMEVAGARGRVLLAGAAIFALLSLRAPGLGPAVLILLMGYANGHLVLAGFGLLTLVAYLVRCYYALDVPLLTKSAYLAGAGVALLLARAALVRAWPVSGSRRA